MFSVTCLSNGQESGSACVSLSFHRPSIHTGNAPSEPTDHFLFNVGEGFQRVCAEQRFKVKLVRGVFLTQYDPCYFGGFPGLHFSLAEAGAASLLLRGPDGVHQLVAAFAKFVRRKWPVIDTKALSVDASLSRIGKANVEHFDPLSFVTVTIAAASSDDFPNPKAFCYWCASDRSTKEDESDDESEGSVSSSSESDSEKSACKQTESDISQSDHESVNGEEVSFLDYGKQPIALCYVIRSREHKGLGTIVVVDCPTKLHIPSLTSNPHMQFHCSLHKVHLVIHLAPAAITNDDAYQRWLREIAKCQPGAQHCFAHYSHSDEAPSAFQSAEKELVQLRQAVPELFPLFMKKRSSEITKTMCTGKFLNIGARVGPWSLIAPRKMDLIFTEPEIPRKPGYLEATHEDINRNVQDTNDSTDITSRLSKENTDTVKRCEPNMNPDEINIDDIPDQTSTSTAHQPKQDNATRGIPSNNQHTDPHEIDIDEEFESLVDQGGKPENPEPDPKRAKLLLDTSNTNESLSTLYPCISFLGTGAARPSKWRGCSAIHVNFGTQYRGVMLDVGEGTFAQLVRRYGLHIARKMVANLEFIWVSHHHVDHHGGLLTIIREFFKSNVGRPLTIIGPTSIGKLLRSMLGSALLEPSNAHTMDGCWVNFVYAPNAAQYFTSTLQQGFQCHSVVQGIQTCKVYHCHDAFAISMDLHLPRGDCRLEPNCRPDAVKFVRVLYSGDTRPCEQVVSLARSRWTSSSGPMDHLNRSDFVNIIIHEATFTDENQVHAKRKKHSTTGEALGIAKRANADFAILTHISQRYNKTKGDGESHTGARIPTGVPFIFASDLMTIPLDTPHDILRLSTLLDTRIQQQSA